MEESEQDSIIEDDTADTERQDTRHPWPYLKELFVVVGYKNDSWRMQYILCLPKKHELLAFKNSPSNLKKHIQVCYLGKRYKNLTAAPLKRKSSTSDEGSSKQLKLWDVKRVSQKSVDEFILNFVIQGLHPGCIVEQQGFKAMINHLQPDVAIMSRGTMKNRVEKATVEMKKNLKAAMNEVEFIATTTDCWTAHRRSFLGVTAHWIETETMTRCSVALACKQLRGSHTFDSVARALNDIHTEFNIRDKIVRTTTDNGSNFIKAFRERQSESDASENSEGEEREQEGNINLIEATTLLNEDDGLEYQLPRHHRCACHLLNLVSTVDVSDANANATYKRLSRSAFSKCWGLWNKSGRSTAAAEIIEEKCKLQLLRPNDTRWNSMYLAVERIIRIMREQGEGAITAVCTTLKLPMFSPAEIAFLSEYVKIMCPVAKAIDVLQGETNVQMGWLIPTITLLKTKLQHLRLSSKCCVPLIDALQSGLQKDPELIAASILVPKFRRCWTRDEGLLQLGLDYIKSHLKELPVTVSDSTPSSEEEDFFSPIKQGNLQENTKQLESYLACPDDTMEVLKSFPAVLNLSLPLNTPLPASAACERLFSTAGLIFRPKRFAFPLIWGWFHFPIV
uniref:Transposase n=1 Tax=Neogobius melanostomus TaxID=47308 RepID=A0A8C6WJZ4_9GOBI